MGYGHGPNMLYGAGHMMHPYGYVAGYDDMMTQEPDFGVIAEVAVNPGVNTFKIQGLGPFTDLKDLAGRGVSVSHIF